MTLYKEQWLKLVSMSDESRAFIAENEARLKVEGLTADPYQRRQGQGEGPRGAYGQATGLERHNSNARLWRGAGEALTDIARTFGVSHTTIGRLRTSG